MKNKKKVRAKRISFFRDSPKRRAAIMAQS